ncbi:MAG: 16S rRNA (guanine(966)-N(2))-methyltransferase RsmD [Gammaproteobacteria bacterium]|nr:MAG: 16S rRNA (guanine(966)-N(2))-methyltransferase RsmD [Gammaproteobacteria bacterium]
MAQQNKTGRTGQCRIIAGKWRGRKLAVAEVEGLRPTPDRVRETLFNWLQPFIGSSQCLDLFSGSGALGFEAASRGAELVTLVELNSKASQQLQTNCTLLSADNCLVENKAAGQFLAENKQQYDIVFIDPPYQKNMWTDVATKLVATKTLSDNAMIYLECSSKGELPLLPDSWVLIKDKQAGEVRYCLFRYEGS